MLVNKEVRISMLKHRIELLMSHGERMNQHLIAKAQREIRKLKAMED